MSAPLVTLRGLAVFYAGSSLPALAGIDLDIGRGETLAVIGESGSGKSTLALALAGLLPDDAAVAGRIDGPGFTRPPRPGRDIGFVFQDAGASLNPVRRVGAQVAEVARVHLGLSRPAARGHALDLFQRVRLSDPYAAARAFPHQLSGGQRQRVAIAAAIAAGPALLIADEPTSALDTIVQAEVVALLNELVAEAGMTLVFITHDIALASGFADRVGVLDQGRLVEAGPIAAVLAAPRDAYTRMLLGCHIGLDTPPLVGGEAVR
ncbi:MAG: ABC transporter ATP-binding protein [Aquamicrobium sp.]|uniref:ATP-binding cassette domain-containing protein n=1 Tax=Aquamicrobium sp. TaxID=1872579 RepID=UPI00349F03E4|nr:ABC transporter ATP-binding protein [Aquamicrobium sp.]